jgi:hypothetical protein
MSETREFDEAVEYRLSRLRDELTAALTDDDYAGAAWAEAAMQDLQRLHRENGTAPLHPPVGEIE